MRRVKFPFELDATDLLSEGLKEQMKAVNARLKEVEKDRMERGKVAKRTKKDKNQELEDWPDSEEKAKRAAEAEEMEKLVDPALKADEGACVTGLYDLIGLVTHKGESPSIARVTVY
jgi:ubiquitin carboxyl-terminal hydrolase 14